MLGIDAVYQRALTGLLQENNYQKAARTAKEYTDWVAQRTDIAEICEELAFLREILQEQQ